MPRRQESANCKRTTANNGVPRGLAGHAPATSFLEGQLQLDDGGYVVTLPDSTATSVPGARVVGASYFFPGGIGGRSASGGSVGRKEWILVIV